MSDQIRVNGNLFSFGSIELKIGEERFTGVTEISYADKLERSQIYGMGRTQPARGVTRGKYTVEESTLTMHKDSAQELRELLKQQAGKNFIGDIEFEIVVQYFESDLDPQTDILSRCRYSGASISNSEGTDATTESITVQPMFISRNGVALYEESKI